MIMSPMSRSKVNILRPHATMVEDLQQTSFHVSRCRCGCPCAMACWRTEAAATSRLFRCRAAFDFCTEHHSRIVSEPILNWLAERMGLMSARNFRPSRSLGHEMWATLDSR